MEDEWAHPMNISHWVTKFSEINLRGKKKHTFNDPNTLTDADYICIGITMGLFVLYHGTLAFLHHRRHFVSFSSHIEFQRVFWAKYVMGATRHKLFIIQCFRSSLMVVKYYMTITLTAAGSVSKPVLSAQEPAAVIRSTVPLSLLLIAFVNFVVCEICYFYLHFHTQVDQLSGRMAERQVSMLTALRSEGGGLDDSQMPGQEFSKHEMAMTKQRTAILVLQCQSHFRLGFRAMLMGMVCILWLFSPWAMLTGAILLVGANLLTDFPFPSVDMDYASLAQAEVRISPKSPEDTSFMGMARSPLIKRTSGLVLEEGVSRSAPAKAPSGWANRRSGRTPDGRNQGDEAQSDSYTEPLPPALAMASSPKYQQSFGTTPVGASVQSMQTFTAGQQSYGTLGDNNGSSPGTSTPLLHSPTQSPALAPSKPGNQNVST